MSRTAPIADLLAGIPLAAIAVDRSERIVAVNAAAESLLGSLPVGRHYITLLRQPAIVEAVEYCLAGRGMKTAEYVIGRDGNDITYEVTVAPVDSSQIVLLSFQDITHVTAAGQMRRDFVANVSHELRTPLTALMGFIETLRGPARDDAAARGRFLEIMAGEAERMNRLVGDLLSLSRVEEEERVRPTAVVDLHSVLATTLRNINPLAVEADVILKPDLGSACFSVIADADQLQQVFTNLIENAIKYGGTGKIVTITANRLVRDAALRGPAVQIAVHDKGQGIDPIHLPRLTERFYRVDSHRSRSVGGTGLGLAIVKHILNRHRGRLRIESELGRGSTFLVTLPLAAI